MRIHVLSGAGAGMYQVMIHAPIPTGNNAAGVSWQTAFVNSGRAVSSMPIGNGPGQISQSEANQVTGGSLIEAYAVWDVNSDINQVAGVAVTDVVDRIKTDLKYFGQTVT